ncbi:MAG: glycosyltransferase [Bacteroidales bacterium]|nr:glycosyltransferase [Bacteroidales bacterium]
MGNLVANQPLVSILIPVYGVEKYIATYTESLLGQTYTNIEFVIVNDGTKDRSMEIFREILDNRFPHLKGRVHIYDKENGGLPSAREFGLRHFTGDYFMFSDSDDLMELDMVEKLVASAVANDSDIAYCDFWAIYPKKIRHRQENDYTNGQSAQWFDDIFNWRATSYLWRCLIKSSILHEHEIVVPPYSMNEDTFIFGQILEFSERISHVKEPLYHYYFREGSIANTSRRYGKNRVERALNYMAMRELFKERGYKLMTKQIRRDIVAYAGWSILKFDRSNFSKYPEILRQCKTFKLGRSLRLPVFKQFLLKAYLCFR